LIFDRLKANDIKLNPEKCVFGVPGGTLHVVVGVANYQQTSGLIGESRAFSFLHTISLGSGPLLDGSSLLRNLLSNPQSL